eukprot:g102.t1
MEAGSPLPDMEVENSFRQNTLRVTPGLPEAICKAPLQDPGALSEFYSQNPINAFDSPRSSPRPWGSQEMRVEGGDGTVIHRFQGRDGIKIEIEIKNQGLKRVE